MSIALVAVATAAPATATKAEAAKLSGSITVSAAASLTEAFTKMGTDFQKANTGHDGHVQLRGVVHAGHADPGRRARRRVRVRRRRQHAEAGHRRSGHRASRSTSRRTCSTIVVKPGNPKNVKSLADLADRRHRVALRAGRCRAASTRHQALSQRRRDDPDRQDHPGRRREGDARRGGHRRRRRRRSSTSPTPRRRARRSRRSRSRRRRTCSRSTRSRRSRRRRTRRLANALDQVRDIGGRTEDTEVVRIPASSARRVSRGRRGVPLVAVALAVVASAFFVLPLVGLLQRAPWGSLWDDLTTPAGARRRMRLSLVCSLWATALSRRASASRSRGCSPARASRDGRSCARSSCCRWCCRRSSAASRCSSRSSATAARRRVALRLVRAAAHVHDVGRGPGRDVRRHAVPRHHGRGRRCARWTGATRTPPPPSAPGGGPCSGASRCR